MKSHSLPLLHLVSVLLAGTCGNAVGEEQPAIVLSPELALNAPEVPDDKNGIVSFERQIDPLDEKSAASLAAALDNLRASTSVDDPALFELLEKRHVTARTALKAPARFPRRTEFAKVSAYSHIFEGADALAHRASLEGNGAAAASYRRDMLEWSRLIRTSHPALLEYLIGMTGSLSAFNGLLREWESHPDQKARLSEIEELYEEYSCPWEELIPVVRRESQFWSDLGGTRGILKRLPGDQSMGYLLREPFSKLTAGELLGLPYEQAPEIRRYEGDQLGIIAAIRNKTPFADWPGSKIEPAGKTLDFYEARPNGLGDLLYDYHRQGLTSGGLSMILFMDPAMRTCLAWLKSEGDGEEFSAKSNGVKEDPMTGKPLTIEPELRRIRSVGPNMKLETFEDGTWLPGIATADDDRLLQVPAWREKAE